MAATASSPAASTHGAVPLAKMLPTATSVSSGSDPMTTATAGRDHTWEFLLNDADGEYNFVPECADLFTLCIDYYAQRLSEKREELLTSLGGGASKFEFKTGNHQGIEEVSALLDKYSRTVAHYESMLARKLPGRRADFFGSQWTDRSRWLNAPPQQYQEEDKVRWFFLKSPWPLNRLAFTDPTRDFTDLFQRSIIAMTGGASLLVPMIIMTFATSRTARLIIVSAAVLLFSVFAAVATAASRENLLGATAAYAAVMVVYVGTALPSAN